MAPFPPLPYANDVESVPPGETQDIEKVMVVLSELLEDHAQVTGRRQRDVHVKSHGCAIGALQVMAGLPDELAQGLFDRPRQYEITIRFSNSSPYLQPDAVPDGRGVAIQVRGVTGDLLPRISAGEPTQDFLLANHPVFVAPNVTDYLRLQQIRLQMRHRPVAALVEALTDGRWHPSGWRWRAAITSARVLSQLPRHPAEYTYFSMVPFRFGKYIAKYCLKPASGQSSPLRGVLLRAAFEANAMRSSLTQTLKESPLRFDFQVQLRRCSRSMPVEDATIEWPERRSPYRTVAQLTLPQQDLTAATREGGDELAFNVWNALSDHRPLGGINRVRREAYRLSAAWRAGRAIGATKSLLQ